MTDPSRGRSRRAVLSACGAGLVALAGCGDLDVPGSGGDDRRTYDPDRLRAVAERGVPSRPDAFPVAVSTGDRERHYDRARALLATVPERPDVPNGAVARRLRKEREHVAGRLGDRERDGDGDRSGSGGETGLRRLSGARHVRANAAGVDGAYRAAVREIDREAVAERRAALRARLGRFEADRAYRGVDPAGALVVGAELEDVSGAVRRDAEAWPPIPADPATDVFGVGEAVRNLESGEAALADAERIRSRYLDGGETRSYRSAITAASYRLERRASWASRRLHEYVEAAPSNPPFDREVEGTPAEHLYRWSRRYLDDSGAREERRAGDHATAALRSARTLAAVGAFRAAIEAIEAGEYGTPADADRVATVRADAVAALETAWATPPAAVSADLSWPAHDALRDGHRDLDRADGREREVDRAVGRFAFAHLYAEAVPAAVGAVVDALDDGGASP